MAEEQDVTLGEAVTMFRATLSPEQQQAGQRELNRFVRWYGADRPISGIKAREVGDYGQSISTSVTDPGKMIEPVRSFLSYVKKQNLSEVSLAPHLRVSKAKRGRAARSNVVEVAPVTLTAAGHASMTAELESLMKERPVVAEQIRLAAADKDVRENAPLDAAKDRQGHLEARIREIEGTLKGASIVGQKRKTDRKAGVGSTVSLTDTKSGEQMTYVLVSPSEADPAEGRLSIASPIGKAVLDREAGAMVEVEAPVGMLRYQIGEIKG
jgi:transcription elongation factor GreA